MLYHFHAQIYTYVDEIMLFESGGLQPVDSIVESCAVCCSAAVFYQCNGVRRQPTLDVLVKFSPENALLHETSLQISFL